MAQAEILQTEISALDGCVVLNDDNIAAAIAVAVDAPAVSLAAAAAAQKDANIALLRKKLKLAALARNGASAPTVATRKLVELNTEKDISCLLLQTRAM